ncbi:MAG: SUMF1/EgtB/PvdO family nonheme iron enzyme [Polyangiaceae bacterium]
MRRSRGLIGSACVLTVVALAGASTRSHAASPAGTVSQSLGDAPQDVAALESRGPELVPVPLERETPKLFGAFLVPSHLSHSVPIQGACSSDMVEVEGDYCPYVTETCLRWLDPETKLRCAQFAHLSDSGKCVAKTDHKRYCMDRYEWPNKEGAVPVQMASWNEATASCSAIGKRLCTDTEWTLACEGPERTPYPYGDGYTRDEQACNIDKPYIWPEPSKLFDTSTRSEELARLDQREASGSRTQCVSAFGVHDMTGNVDEWVLNESQGGRPYRSGLKGGYWGPVRTRCRPMTTAHNESFKYYQIGFRCCADAHTVDVGALPLAQTP